MALALLYALFCTVAAFLYRIVFYNVYKDTPIKRNYPPPPGAVLVVKRSPNPCNWGPQGRGDNARGGDVFQTPHSARSTSLF